MRVTQEKGNEMKNRERWLSNIALLVSILPFILAAGSLQLLPDRIVLPNILEGEALTISKYQYLYFGIFGLVPAALVIIARILHGRKLVEHNFMFMVIASLCLGCVFLFVSIYGLIYHIHIYDIDLIMQFDFYGGAVVIVSLAGGMLSTYLPQLRRNDVFGLKNKFTMTDSRVWEKVHVTAADVYMSVFFSFAMLVSLLGIWLNPRYGWLQIILWVLAVAGLILWGRLYSQSVAKRLAVSDAEELTTIETV